MLGIGAMVAVIAIGAVGSLALGDDEALPLTLTTRDATAIARSATTTLRFPLTLTRAVDRPVVVAYTVRGGTPADGATTIPAGTRSGEIVVTAPTATTSDSGAVTVRLRRPDGVRLTRFLARGAVVRAPDAVRVAAAGDVACAPGDRATGTECNQVETSDLLVAGGFDAVLTLGDNQYPGGALSDYRGAFAPSWGRVLEVVRPAPGNHDYVTAGAAGYFAFFGQRAGDPALGFQSLDLGAWHVVQLNSNCDAVPCARGSAQERWLRADLARATGRCVLAYWHHPRFSSGSTHGSDPRTAALYADLRRAGADVVLTGHEHQYERLGHTGVDGRADPLGPRLFVVGTGGRSLYPFGDPLPTSEVRDDRSFGVLELTLRPGRYAWAFRTVDGAVADRGDDHC